MHTNDSITFSGTSFSFLLPQTADPQGSGKDINGPRITWQPYEDQLTRFGDAADCVSSCQDGEDVCSLVRSQVQIQLCNVLFPEYSWLPCLESSTLTNPCQTYEVYRGSLHECKHCLIRLMTTGDRWFNIKRQRHRMISLEYSPGVCTKGKKQTCCHFGSSRVLSGNASFTSTNAQSYDQQIQKNPNVWSRCYLSWERFFSKSFIYTFYIVTLENQIMLGRVPVPLWIRA